MNRVDTAKSGDRACLDRVEVCVTRWLLARYLAHTLGGQAPEWDAILEIDDDPAVEGKAELTPFVDGDGVLQYRASEIESFLRAYMPEPPFVALEILRFYESLTQPVGDSDGENPAQE